jgi:hypothetical protein
MADVRARKQKRVPVEITGSIRNLLSNPEINKTGYTYKDLFTRAEAQLACFLEYEYYVRHNLICDREMGLPADGWQATLTFQNSYDQAWFGCPFRYFGDTDVPDTEEILKANPKALYGWEDPHPFWGRGDFMKRAMEMYEAIRKICESGYEYYGLPVFPPRSFPLAGTDGVFTVALKLRGAVELMMDMYVNPSYFHDLMDYVTRNMIARIKAHREWSWDHDPACTRNRQHQGRFSYADDSIAMISLDQFREFVEPYQRRLFEAFDDGRGATMHLCGDASHHFRYLTDTFGIRAFDTGFPVDHGKLRRGLGPNVHIRGGPAVMLVKDGTPKQIASETRRVCESGVMNGRRFTLIAANNLAPCTPIENVKALYDAGCRYGRY